MNSKVKVTADAAGNVIVQSVNNPEFGYVRVEQEKVLFSDSGFMERKVISALVHGQLKDLSFLKWTANQELNGSIVVRESLVAFNKKNPEKDFKVAGETGIICSVDGCPIYRKLTYSTSSSIPDETIKHDNSEAIREKSIELKSSIANVITSKQEADFSM